MSTVLVAEDDFAIRDLLTFLLDESGHQVIACADGSSALATARREHPDLAILDVSMPGINGIEVCRALRETADTELMPVLTDHRGTPSATASRRLVRGLGTQRAAV